MTAHRKLTDSQITTLRCDMAQRQVLHRQQADNPPGMVSEIAEPPESPYNRFNEIQL